MKKIIFLLLLYSNNLFSQQITLKDILYVPSHNEEDIRHLLSSKKFTYYRQHKDSLGERSVFAYREKEDAPITSYFEIATPFDLETHVQAYNFYLKPSLCEKINEECKNAGFNVTHTGVMSNGDFYTKVENRISEITFSYPKGASESKLNIISIRLLRGNELLNYINGSTISFEKCTQMLSYWKYPNIFKFWKSKGFKYCNKDSNSLSKLYIYANSEDTIQICMNSSNMVYKIVFLSSNKYWHEMAQKGISDYNYYVYKEFSQEHTIFRNSLQLQVSLLSSPEDKIYCTSFTIPKLNPYPFDF